MAYRVFRESTTLDDAEESCAYTVEALDAYPVEAVRAFAAPLAAHLEVLPPITAARRTARRRAIRGAARVRVANGVADDEVRELAKDVLGSVRQDRAAPLYRAFFKTSPSDVADMSLAPEVAEIEGWPGILASNPDAAPLASEWRPRLEAVVERGRAALAERSEAAATSAEIQLAARDWIERADRMRRAIDGALTVFAADRGLDRHFNDRFFPPAPKRGRRDDGNDDPDD